jgi:hypothetical protein
MAAKGGTSTFQVTEDGVLQLSVAYIETPQGLAWMDQAVLFCPFCGKPLQDKETIRKKAH